MSGFIFPLLYCVIVGWSWSATFKKRFDDSLAPAFFFHIMLMLLSGLFFQNLSFGFYFGLALSIVLLVSNIIKEKDTKIILAFKAGFNEMWTTGLYSFIILFLFCFITNIGKHFILWDEFSHWGQFLKESLRLDALYCTSSVSMAHKDYVPAITLFETIWCRLCMRYHESDVYRAIQILMFSMMLPMFRNFYPPILPKDKERKYVVKQLFAKLPLLGAMLLVLLLPLIFNTSFYHTIYQDFILGILIFYCMMESYRDYDDIKYQIVIQTLVLTVFVLSKMISIVLFPMIILFFVIKLFVFSREKIVKKYYLLTFPITIPVVFWFVYNRFIDEFIDNSGGYQSYDGFHFASIINVFTHNNAISYQDEVQRTYLSAIFTKDILLHGSYVVALLFIVVAILVIAYLEKDKVVQKKILLMDLWIFLAGVVYAVLMYFLYLTAFSEWEAKILTSFERYMDSFIAAAVFITIAIYYTSGVCKGYRKGFYILLTILSVNLCFFHINTFSQIVPGYFTHDKEKMEDSLLKGEYIKLNTPENARIYLVTRGDNGEAVFHLRYYANPRLLDGASVGPEAFEGDLWSYDISVEEFVATVADYDYLYLNVIDDMFIEKYSAAFEDFSLVHSGTLYKISVDDGKIWFVDEKK